MDFVKIRKARQSATICSAIAEIRGECTEKSSVNRKGYERALDASGLNEEEFLTKCGTDTAFAGIVGLLVAKRSSRQGILDEKLQFSTISSRIQTSSGIECIHLGNKSSFYPSYCPSTSDVFHRCQKFKSFDGRVVCKESDETICWIFAKVVIGAGGHQDNVFIEAYSICEWAGISGVPVMIVIDGDRDLKLAELKRGASGFASVIFVGNSGDASKFIGDMATYTYVKNKE